MGVSSGHRKEMRRFSTFRVDYRALNKRMKEDKFPIPSAKEVIKDMAGGEVFAKLDMFATYWKARLADHERKSRHSHVSTNRLNFWVFPSNL